MAVQDKPTLKSYFNTGDTPTESQFADLIDSFEDTSNKSTTFSADQGSDVKFPSVKSVYDWATGLFMTQSNGEQVANKSTSVTTDATSNTKYPSVKSVYDWATGLFMTLAKSETILCSRYANITNSGTTEAIVLAIYIPAGTIGANDAIYAKAVAKFTGTSNAALRFYFNTSNSLSGATIWATAGIANQGWQLLIRNYLMTGATNAAATSIVSTTSTQTDESSITNSIGSTYSVDFSTDQYLLITTAGGTTTSTLRDVFILKRPYL